MLTPPEHPRLALVEATVQKILLREQIMKPPVPVKDLLEQFAIVCPFEHQSEPSFCLEQDSIWYVFINSKISAHSVGFIQASEMGHLFMNHLTFDNGNLTAPQFQLMKLEADHFANNLLMPEAWIRSACGNNCVDEPAAARLAKLFSVTQTTMNNRLRHLEIHCGPAHN